MERPLPSYLEKGQYQGRADALLAASRGYDKRTDLALKVQDSELAASHDLAPCLDHEAHHTPLPRLGQAPAKVFLNFLRRLFREAILVQVGGV
jgi:hypothetical protein